MALVSNGVVGDGSWLLEITVTDLPVQRKLRVQGGLHIGGLMLRLVEDLDVSRDWSDHALWWPARRRWLVHTRSTLDQVGVTAETELEFTPMHKVARVQLPDRQTVDARLDYSVPVFNSVVELCKELGIRHPEELSLRRFYPAEELRRSSAPAEGERQRRGSLSGPATLKKQAPISASVSNIARPPAAVNTSANNDAVDGTLPRSPAINDTYQSGTLGSRTGLRAPVLPSVSWGEGLAEGQWEAALVQSPRVPPRSLQPEELVPSNYEQKAALNRGWLDSSRSLMEQGVFEGDLVLLRFKFMHFFDLNPRYDPVRLNQLYEQAKWSMLLEEFDCTEEEAYMFGALQLQATLAAGRPEPRAEEGDDVERMLDELEESLDAAAARRDITHVPHLDEYLRYFKPKKLTLKNWKRGFFVFRDLYLSWYHGVSDTQGPPVGRFLLKGCEVTPEVNLANNKFVIKLLIPTPEGMQEIWLRCDSQQQYAKWMAGCRLAARGRTMADAGYQAEVDSIRRLLDMQQPSSAPPPAAPSTSAHGNGPAAAHMPDNLRPDEFVSQRFAKRAKSRQQMEQRLGEAHANVRELTTAAAKLQYVRAWQALPEHGLHYFVMRLRGQKRAELLAVAHNRLVRMTLDTADNLKTWRFATMKRWHVNWEIKHVLVQMEDENVEFQPLSADCKVVHEFIGGYIFMSMRSKEQNQTLNEELFHKLTGGWMQNASAVTP